ncbi:UNVERIFIED_CONTAM: hypothetical protein GTU68_043836 [Idotea baltica]|nr:hypothetical protein [Idotea baltica]
MEGKTLFDKIWDRHVVAEAEDGPQTLYIDRHFIHEVTSPQAFGGLRKRGLPVFRPHQTIATADHNVPTENQHLPIREPLSRLQVETLVKNCEEFGLELYGLGHDYQGIVHVIGPELGITLPGMTIVCGDSHTSTHGAFGTIAFGIGTSEVEQVLATQCVLKDKHIEPMITYGTNPGMGIKISESIPLLTEMADESERNALKKSLTYMDLEQGDSLLGKSVDYVFIGSCTNSRIEDLRLIADFVKGKQKAEHIHAMVVPGSQQVRKQAREEGLDKILADAGFILREPGCSACLGMNEDKVPAGKYCVSTSNRNFEGRQGPGARTFLASPLTAAATAITGRITDARELI